MGKTKTTIEELTYGEEPTWSEKHVTTPLIISTFLNWYSYTKESEHAKKYLLEYVKSTDSKNKVLINFIENENEKTLKKTYCWLMRIILRSEASVPNNVKEKVDAYIKELNIKATQPKVKKVDEDHIIKSKPQSKKPMAYLDTITLLDTKIDQFVETRQFNKLNLTEYLKEFPHSDNDIKLLLEFINHQKQYYETVLTDKELLEGYSFLTKKEIKSIDFFYSECVSEVETFINNKISQSAIKKPRKKKKIKPENLVKKMKHKLEDSDLNIKSIDSKTIIGKNCLLVFNVKTRQLSIYYSDTGFSVKGSTLLNFNAESSFGKVLRNPEKEIDKYLIINKNVLETKINDIKAVKKKLTGRINSDMVLLKVF